MEIIALYKKDKFVCDPRCVGNYFDCANCDGDIFFRSADFGLARSGEIDVTGWTIAEVVDLMRAAVLNGRVGKYYRL